MDDIDEARDWRGEEIDCAGCAHRPLRVRGCGSFWSGGILVHVAWSAATDGERSRAQVSVCPLGHMLPSPEIIHR